jgi:hypothetical protein
MKTESTLQQFTRSGATGNVYFHLVRVVLKECPISKRQSFSKEFKQEPIYVLDKNRKPATDIA